MANFNRLSSDFQAFSARSVSADQRRLERLWHLPTMPSEPSEPSGLLRRLGHQLMQFFTNSQQIRVWTKSTKAGTVWFAYDPATGRTAERLSEDDLRGWLEKRYQH